MIIRRIGRVIMITLEDDDVLHSLDVDATTERFLVKDMEVIDEVEVVE
jgi:hypothetical protein